MKAPLRYLLIFFGFVSVALGLLGIILPLLPTTPFLLLAAFFFARSSERFHHWLLNNRVFGEYIRNYQEGKGLPLRYKISTISLLWFTIILSMIYATEELWLRLFLGIIAVGVTWHLLRLPTLGR